MDHIYKENDLKVLRQTWESSFDLRRRATEKGILNDERNSKIIIRVYHWIRKSPFVFEDGYRTINFWDCDDNKFFHLIKFNIVCNLRKNEQIVILDHQLNIKELSILEAGGFQIYIRFCAVFHSSFILFVFFLVMWKPLCKPRTPTIRSLMIHERL